MPYVLRSCEKCGAPTRQKKTRKDGVRQYRCEECQHVEVIECG